MVERTFPEGLEIPMTDGGSSACQVVVEKNATSGVTWIHSYVSSDKKKTYCIYDGPDEAAVRESAAKNGLPVDSVVSVTVLDPYFYH
jgi:glycerate kinase